ncbi:TIGR04255 family protein [bacterium]|nr:TIGR04255 family protein [bacterium]
MGYPDLSNPPLVEAIFELYWQLRQRQDEPPEFNYGILAGRIYEKLSDDYPFHEPLPTASMPAEIAAHVIQHRFRKGKNEWPLVQMGPGILTLNHTKQGFKRDVFHCGIEALVQVFLSIYQDDQKPTFSRLMLRYIDAVDFDYQAENVSEYISRTLKTDVTAKPSLLEGTGVSTSPTALDSTIFFASDRPKGQLRLRFGRGSRNNKDLLTWETIVETTGQDVPQDTEEIASWANDADELIHKIFFRMIEGELMERFK